MSVMPPGVTCSNGDNVNVGSAYFVGNTLGPLTGGVVAATVGIRYVFAVTAALLVLNLVWVWFTVPEANSEPGMPPAAA